MIENSFEKGPEGWCSYDYHWSVVARGVNIFVLATWEPLGGVNDSGYVWSDEARWSADTPEDPVSILPLMIYRSWVDGDPLDLRDAQVSVYLRGDNLQLDGAKCLFWVHAEGVRWHLKSRPLTIGDGNWTAQPNVFTLDNDESLWRLSWASEPSSAPSLNEVMASAHSYGFSFVGFGQEPRGKFSMDEFRITLAGAR